MGDREPLPAWRQTSSVGETGTYSQQLKTKDKQGLISHRPAAFQGQSALSWNQPLGDKLKGLQGELPEFKGPATGQHGRGSWPGTSSEQGSGDTAVTGQGSSYFQPGLEEGKVFLELDRDTAGSKTHLEQTAD